MLLDIAVKARVKECLYQLESRKKQMACSSWKIEERLIKGLFINVWPSFRKVARDGVAPPWAGSNRNPISQGARTKNTLERDDQTVSNLGFLVGEQSQPIVTLQGRQVGCGNKYPTSVSSFPLAHLPGPPIIQIQPKIRGQGSLVSASHTRRPKGKI